MAKARGISKHTPIYIKRDIDTFLETKIADKKSGIVFVHGQGGLGKSTLLQSIKNFTTAQKTPMIFIDLKEPKDTNMVSLLLDKSITTIDNCPKFENIRKLIEDKPELFADILERYDKESSGAIENSKKVDESYGVAMQTVVDILKVGAKFFKHNSEKAYKEITDYTDFILIGALSDDFKPHGVFIVDTFEKIKNIDIISKIVFLPNGEIDKSIQERHYRLKDYIEGLIYLMSEHTTFVIAGRNKIEDLSMDLPHEDVEEIGMDNFSTTNIKDYFKMSNVTLPNDETINYIHQITNGNALLISLFPKIYKDFEGDWDKLDRDEIDRVMAEDEEHGLLFYLTDRVFSHIDRDLEIYKLAIPRVLNRDIEQILYPDIKVFDNMVTNGLIYKGKGSNFNQFYLHDSVKMAIKANNKRTMRKGYSSHHDNPEIVTIHTEMIEYYQTYQLDNNINKELEICYHSMLSREDFERDFSKDREEFVDLAFASLSLDNNDKNKICKAFDRFGLDEISGLIRVFYEEREGWLNMMSSQLYNRLRLEAGRGEEDVLKNLKLLIKLTKEKMFTDDGILYYLIGQIYYEKDEYNNAIEAYQKAIEINPKSDNAYNNMGNAYDELKEYDKAIPFYQKAIEINPKQREAYTNMFELQLILNQDFSLEESFLAHFAENKEAMMRYEMLKVLRSITTNKPYALTVELWSEKYRDIELNWGWDELDGWIATMPNGERKAKLTEAIEVFKAHKRY